MQWIGRALRPGGIVGIYEPVRQDAAGKIQQIGSLMDLFFGFFREAGMWSAAEIADSLPEEGLKATRPRSPWMMSGLALHVGPKAS